MEDSTRYMNQKGVAYVQLFQEFPILEPLYIDWEKNWGFDSALKFSQDHYLMPFIICIAYVIWVFGGQWVMKNREPFQLKVPLAAWNFLLALFSICGALRTVPHFLNILYSKGFYYGLCADPEIAYGRGACGLWVCLFIYSKVPELGDTVFKVLRKKSIIFLHWYHHVTVLLFCWHSYATESSAGLWFIVMNYCVHALMYFYYFLTSIGIYPKWSLYVTIAQTSQMLVGVVVCSGVWYFSAQGLDCKQTRENYIAGLLMYASYFALFFILLLGRYVFPPKKSEDKAPAKEVETEQPKDVRKRVTATKAEE